MYPCNPLVFCSLIRSSGTSASCCSSKVSITDTQPLPHGRCRCWGMLPCGFYGATVENTLFEDGDASNTFRAFNRLKRKKPTRWLPPTGSGHRHSLLQQALAALLHAVCAKWLVDERGVVGLALNLRAYDLLAKSSGQRKTQSLKRSTPRIFC